jgi:hypothetical protein
MFRKIETFKIWAIFTLEGPHIVMSRTDAQNGLDFHFNIQKNGNSWKYTQIICCLFSLIY